MIPDADKSLFTLGLLPFSVSSMSRLRSNGSLFHHNTDSADFSKNYAPHMTGSSSSSAYKAVPSSTNHLPSDLPDLYYDQDLPSPPSATSSNMIPTPPPDRLSPWHQTKSNCNPSYPTLPWQSSPLIYCQGSRPTDANFNWKDHAAIVEPSVLFTTSEEFDLGQKFRPYPLSYPQAYSHTQSNTTFQQPSVLSSHHPSTNGSAPPSLSPVPSSNLCPHQPPLKLHQPRPSRRIPIISLSNLASACDTFPVQTPATDPRGRVSGEVLLPLSFQPSNSSSTLQSPRTITQYPNIRIEPAPLHSTNSTYTPTFFWGTHDDPGKVLSCNCGCQESYIFN